VLAWSITGVDCRYGHKNEYSFSENSRVSVVPFAVFLDTKRLETQRRIDKNMQYMTEDIYKPSFHNDVSNSKYFKIIWLCNILGWTLRDQGYSIY
jgi:hypothetical protein